MNTIRNTRRRHALVLSALNLALLGALAAPAHAGSVCVSHYYSNTDVNDHSYSISTGLESYACGYYNQAQADFSTAMGQHNVSSGLRSTAMGYYNASSGPDSVALGFRNITAGTVTTAVGAENYAGGDAASAMGRSNQAVGIRSSAFGYSNEVNGESSSGFGFDNTVNGNFSNAFGRGNVTSASGAEAFGSFNTASGQASSAFGRTNSATGDFSNVFGSDSTAGGSGSNAIGRLNTASGGTSNAFGSSNTATHTFSNAFGYNNDAEANSASAFGAANKASGAGSSAIGYTNTAYGQNSTAVGGGNIAAGTHSSAFGFGNTASGMYSSAFGYKAMATNIGSVAIGYQSVADRDYAVSVGKTGTEHQIIHLADGTEDFDAVNVRQLRSLANWFGGGAAFAGGAFTAPTFVIQGSNYSTVASAFAAVDSRLTALSSGGGGGIGPAGDSAYQVALNNGFEGGETEWLASLVGPQGEQGEQGPAGPMGPSGPSGPAGADGASAYQVAVDNGFVGTEEQWLASLEGGAGGYDADAVHYDDAGHATVTLKGADGTQLKNVGDGVDAKDAANKGQMDAGDAQALATSKTYTDTKFASWSDSFTQFRNDVDQRFARTDARIDRMGALGGAMAAAALNTAGLPGQNRVGVGFGMQGGRSAMAVSYQRLVRPNASVSIGGAFSGNENSVSAGAGFSW